MQMLQIRILPATSPSLHGAGPQHARAGGVWPPACFEPRGPGGRFGRGGPRGVRASLFQAGAATGAAAAGCFCGRGRRHLRGVVSGRVAAASVGTSVREVIEGQEAVVEAVEALGGPVVEVDEVTPGPGLSNRHLRLKCRGGDVFLAKVHKSSAAAFEGEHAGLQALRVAARGSGVVVPRPHTLGLLPDNRGSFLILDFLQFVPFGPSIPSVLERLGHGLATIHGAAEAVAGTSDGTGPNGAAAVNETRIIGEAAAVPYGFDGLETFLGSWQQPNEGGDDFASFFVERRLRPQLERASLKFQFRYGTSNEASTAVARLYDRVLERSAEVLAPVGSCAPSLLHGDLWTGNTGATREREPIILDPACWRGHSEFDLALSQLFGRFAPPFYDAYFEAAPKQPGFEERLRIYVLYHMLNQANLYGAGFGRGGSAENPGGYLEQAVEAMERIVA